MSTIYKNYDHTISKPYWESLYKYGEGRGIRIVNRIDNSNGLIVNFCWADELVINLSLEQ